MPDFPTHDGRGQRGRHVTEREILKRLDELRREYAHDGMLITDYFNGIIRAVFQVTAEILHDADDHNS